MTIPAPTTTRDEATAARDDVAKRLEGLARQVRASTTTEVAALDEAYSAVVKLARRLKEALDF
jgi:hypothetical protein